MNFIKKTIWGGMYFFSLAGARKGPFLVSWELTRRCNLRCRYCGIWKNPSPELNTSQVKKIVRELRESGTRIVKFTGGEPLLREDIFEIIEAAHDAGMLVILTTNGALLPLRISGLKRVHRVILSLDGDEKTHDAVRGQGAFRDVMEAIDAAKRHRIAVTLSAVLSSLNLDEIPFLLNFATESQTEIFFQPADKETLVDGSPDPIACAAEPYRRAIAHLIREKRKHRYIGNSLSGLRHLYHWPEKKDIPCVAGKSICRLDVSGNLLACPRRREKDAVSSVPLDGFHVCFNRLSPPKCRDCWCSSFVELNLISSFRWDAVANILKGRM